MVKSEPKNREVCKTTIKYVFIIIYYNNEYVYEFRNKKKNFVDM